MILYQRLANYADFKIYAENEHSNIYRDIFPVLCMSISSFDIISPRKLI